MSITAYQRQVVRERAGECCEYCRLPQSGGTITFHIDHVIPLKHDGLDELDNLCLACYQCNGYKGADISGFDPDTGTLTRLYDPRHHVWDDHFQLNPDATIDGRTPEGRVTVRVMRLNEKRRVERRQLLIDVGLYPCLPED